MLSKFSTYLRARYHCTGPSHVTHIGHIVGAAVDGVLQSPGGQHCDAEVLDCGVRETNDIATMTISI